MANSDKNIIITPYVSGITQPQILFVGQGNDPITLKVLDGITGSGATAGGGLSVEGSAGQLFSIINRLGTGSIFSVNDISGIPSIDVDANGFISVAGFTGQVGLGYTGASGAVKLAVNGNAFFNGQIQNNGQFVTGRTTSGFTFADTAGNTLTFLSFTPRKSCDATPGGLWMKDGIFQVGGNAFNNLPSAAFYYSPCNERLRAYGSTELVMDQSYQSHRNIFDLLLNSGATGEAIRVFRGLTHVSGLNSYGLIWGSGLSAGASGAVIQGLVTAISGISASGATFSGDIAVNGGDITTTSATATLYNTTATTVNIGNAASTVNLMGATTNTQTGIGSKCYVKTGQTSTTSTAKQEIFRYPSSQFSFTADTFFADLIITANRDTLGTNPNNQITKMLVVSSTGSTINHTEYGNVNTGGNLAVYTAELSGTNVIIYATPTDSRITAFSVYATLIKGTYGFNTEE